MSTAGQLSAELHLPVAEPRLLALRLHGFKSFAERTTIEFGRGISAVVGPNGSGKSNLADALRWALGEQGRALRSRKAEDVIWAGSEKRAAQGMADVTLVIDNADGLLPVDFQVLELGRRLYRSGENDYLLNKSRVRLRDLVDLLDAAHLADNAFLFIGQGMVDQALALRPEERRPLFDEVAGVRRHERRRRHAEEQLVESETNLARVEDILAELRPQARRLAAQAEQQATRESTADDLVTALLASMHARWFEAAARVATATAMRDRARAEVDRLLEDLGRAEGAASTLALELAARTVIERERRDAHDAAQTIATDARLREARLTSEAEALERERRRSTVERAAAETELTDARRVLAVPVPPRDLELDSSLVEAERELADALAEFAELRGADQARGQELAALRRAAAARQAEIDGARRRLADLERRVAEAQDQAASTAARRLDLEARLATAQRDLESAREAERAATLAHEAARQGASAAEAARVGANERLAGLSATLAAARARLSALESRLAEEESRGIAKAARRVGGQRLDEDLVIAPELRAAAEVALAEATRSYVVASAAVAALAGERGHLVISERTTGVAAEDQQERRFRERLAAAGGGRLDLAVRRDSQGAARRLLARCVWLPDLAACLAIQADLPPGWVAVPRDGGALVTDVAVSLGSSESLLERRAETTRLRAEVGALETDVAREREELESTTAAATHASAATDVARTTESRSTGMRRSAEEAERLAARQLEAIVRESAWHEAQTERLVAELERARSVATAQARDPVATPSADGGATAPVADGPATTAWELRAAELGARRDRIAEEVRTSDALRREAEHRRARAEAAAQLGEERMVRTEREIAGLSDRERGLTDARDVLRDEMASATAREGATRAALVASRAADAADRERLSVAEAEAAAARDRLRAADERLRAADHADLEARLGLDSLREGVVAELAGLGPPGISRLAADAAIDVEIAPASSSALGDAADQSDEVAALEAALAAVASIWAATPPTVPPPSAIRLGQLRRRFHELGAVNPYAVDEYAALRTRLEGLEGQSADLRQAIARTRELIGELDGLISDRFESTFRALETAFARRFEQLFGGGFARLSLTDPADVGSSGIEIVARPPGKKTKALAMLSGGERALTAVALLFAMLEIRPVPFCVLDEVDAALDEANIGRFAEALRSLAHTTQFIVITHNRGTIEAADALYGVTSGDDSVSRVISLRLDEAQALAARDRSELAPAG
jgi:chromosome segregation protein